MSVEGIDEPLSMWCAETGKRLPVTHRGMVMVKRFEAGEMFESSDAARRFLNAKGWSVGAMQRGEPRGVIKGEAVIAKWRNLITMEIRQLDGRLIYPDASPYAGSAELWMKVAI